MLIGLVDLLNDRWSGIVRITVYVDDLSSALAGARVMIMAIAAAACDVAVSFFEDKLAMKVSPTKTVVVGSRMSLARRVARVARRLRAARPRLANFWVQLQREELAERLACSRCAPQHSPRRPPESGL